ncbi:hypothetical protein ACIPZF_18385 [Pseudomonas sp. NPDC089752]|uniref:hypothetical protein n=1 Tax=Pseudomonas sp. NPDC089752 TaxID=3364472 RepID=UPI0038104458
MKNDTRSVFQSAPLSFSVVSAPTIDSVVGNYGDQIAHAGRTISRTVTLSGSATPGQQISLLLNGLAVGTYTANPSGVWSTSSAVSLVHGNHQFIAQINEGQIQSAVRELRRVNGGYEDFSGLRDGQTFLDGKSTSLDSGLIIEPGKGDTGITSNARINAHNGGLALVYDNLSEGGPAWNRVWLAFADLVVPLERPLVVTVRLQATGSRNRLVAYLAWAESNQAGVQKLHAGFDYFSINETVKSFVFPANAYYPIPGYSTQGLVLDISVKSNTTDIAEIISGSATIIIDSVRWEELPA